MSPRFVRGRENVPCVAEVVNRSLKADCTDFNVDVEIRPNCTSLILLIYSSFSTRRLTTTAYSYSFIWAYVCEISNVSEVYQINFKFLCFSVKFLCWCLVTFKDKFLILNPLTSI